jgi:hypothetical protein
MEEMEGLPLEKLKDQLKDYPIELRYSKEKGRYLVSTVDIKEEALIFRVRMVQQRITESLGSPIYFFYHGELQEESL